jgi:hypothetical protein
MDHWIGKPEKLYDFWRAIFESTNAGPFCNTVRPLVRSIVGGRCSARSRHVDTRDPEDAGWGGVMEID